MYWLLLSGAALWMSIPIYLALLLLVMHAVRKLRMKHHVGLSGWALRYSISLCVWSDPDAFFFFRFGLGPARDIPHSEFPDDILLVDSVSVSGRCRSEDHHGPMDFESTCRCRLDRVFDLHGRNVPEENGSSRGDHSGTLKPSHRCASTRFNHSLPFLEENIT